MSTEPVVRQPGLRHVIHTRLLSENPSQTALVSIHRESRRQEEGAALIATVLTVTLLMTGMLVITARLSLSSRINTVDQTTALQAQYKAESNLALATQKVKDYQDLLDKNNFFIPLGTRVTDMFIYANNFCGGTAWITTTAFSYPQVCTVVNSNASTNQFDVLANFLTNYSALPAAERPSNTTTDRSSFWRSKFGVPIVSGTGKDETTYQINPDKVERISANKFKFWFKLTGIQAKGGSLNAIRKISANPIASNGWWVELDRSTFFDNVLFTNHHRQRTDTSVGAKPNVVFVTEQTWDGNIHTNEGFLFNDNSSPKFLGTVNSAGCDDLPTNGIALTCVRTPKVFENVAQNAVRIDPNAGLTTSSAINQNILSKLNVAGTNPVFTGGNPDFTASYRPLPQNATDQSTAAQGTSVDYPGTRGLYFGNDVTAIDLYTTNSAGTPITSGYDATTKTWPTATYQYIKVQIGSSTDLYRVKANKQIEKQANSTGPWVTQPLPFNGVIYSAAGIGRLAGPIRTSTNLAAMKTPDTASAQYSPPALASFMEMNISANASIDIQGDLTLADAPCVPSETACVNAKKPVAENVLQLYSQTGDITVTTGDVPSASNYNLNIHAMVQASQGQFSVTNHNKAGSYKGKINLIGGLVENWYGPNGTTTPTGYNRNYAYDRRFEDPNFGPPAPPISPIWQVAQPSSATASNLNAIDWRQDTP